MKAPAIFKLFQIPKRGKPLCGTRVKEAVKTLKAVANGKGEPKLRVKPTR